jgi:hypothetical protein
MENTMKNTMENTMNTVLASALLLLALALSAPPVAAEDAYATTCVKPHTTDVFRHEFAAGKLAVVSVEGDGDTDLDLRVYDGKGRLVASDLDATDRCGAVWVPERSGRFKVEVENRGVVYNRYTVRFRSFRYTRTETVDSHDTDSYEGWFAAGEEAVAVVVGDGDTDLDVRVYDGKGRLVASDLGATDRCAVRWTPPRSGSYTVKVENRGVVCNRYTVAID